MTDVQPIHEAIAADIAGFGGHLACTVCGHVSALGHIGSNLATGWPKCCGYTMRWHTARELALSQEDN